MQREKKLFRPFRGFGVSGTSSPTAYAMGYCLAPHPGLPNLLGSNRLHLLAEMTEGMYIGFLSGFLARRRWIR
jgi:hypothetical protein